jgi:pilus assembly protein Flp/PilA
MKTLKQTVTNLIQQESGQDLIEYALVAALVGLGAVTAMNGLSNAIKNAFTSISNSLSTNT